MTSSAPSEAKGRNAALDRLLEVVSKLTSEHPDRLAEEAFRRDVLASMAAACGDERAALMSLLARLLEADAKVRKLTAQREEVAALLKSMREHAVLAWILTAPFTKNGNGRRFVYALALARDAAPQCYEVPAADEDHDHPPQDLPAPPFLGYIDHSTMLFFGPASGPAVPLPAEVLSVVSARPDTAFAVGELEVTSGADERTFTVLAGRELAADVKRRLDDEGEAVSVRTELGVATGIHASERLREDWLEFPSLEGPGLSELVFPDDIRKEWEVDVKRMLSDNAPRVFLIGPTGTGKTSAVELLGRDAVRLAAQRGTPKKGFALIRIDAAHIGSSYVHAVARTMGRAFKRAERLAQREDYVVIMLFDEADALLGELSGGGLEHDFSREERLAAQSLLTRDLKGVGIYLTANCRRRSYLGPAISRRFLRREIPPASRRQISAVATRCAARQPDMLAALGMAAEEFGEALSMNLFSDRRVIAVARCHSGREVPIRARDLQTASPGKIKVLIEDFSFALAEKEARGLDDLWNRLDREFRVAELSPENVHDLTFLRPFGDDSVRSIDVSR